MVSVAAFDVGERDVERTAVPVDGIRVDILRGTEGLARIREEWCQLYAQAALPEQVFLSEAWISLWCDHYLDGDGSSLVLVTCRDGDRLDLVWPLHEVRRLGLSLLKWAGEPVSQYGDVLVRQTPRTPQLLEAAWHSILSLAPDALVLRKTRSTSIAARFLASKRPFVSEHDQAPFIDLAGHACPKKHAERYSSKDRKNRRRHRKRLCETGEVGFHWLAPSPEAGALANEAVLMKRNWLTRRGRISKAFTDRRIESFLADALSGAEGGPDGRVGVITVAGAPAALLVGFLNKGYYAGFLTAYDMAHERHGPGALLFEDAIAAAIGERIDRIDLLAPADAYKADWASAEVPIEDLCLPLSMPGRIYTRVVQAGLRQGIKTGIESMPPKLRRAVLLLAATLPALLYSGGEL